MVTGDDIICPAYIHHSLVDRKLLYEDTYANNNTSTGYGSDRPKIDVTEEQHQQQHLQHSVKMSGRVALMSNASSSPTTTCSSSQSPNEILHTGT